MMNVFTFIGRLGGDAEMRATQSGTMLCSFSVAVDSGWGDNKKTTWVRCAYFGDRGQGVCPYLIKGDRVGVSGEAFLHSYEKRDGSAVTELNVRVNDVTLLGENKQGATAAAPQQKTEAVVEQPDFKMVDDDIPF